MKNSILFVIILAAVVVNSGCSSKLMSFEKRKYNKGYHVEFADKNNRKNTTASTENFAAIPQQEVKEIITTDCSNTIYQPVPELTASNNFIAEESSDIVQPEQKTASAEHKKFFQNPILKYFSGAKIKATAKHSLDKLVIKKNIAGTNQTTGTSIFSILGVAIGGGSLVALAVMLFSSWASILLTILFLSGIALGFVLLIVGANV